MNKGPERSFPWAPRPKDESDLEDLTLVKGTLNGDSGAFDAIYRKYRERVYRILYRVVHNREEALEATQDVFVRVYKALATFNPEARFFTWVYRIAVNRGIDLLRRRKVRKEQYYDQEFTLPREDQPVTRRLPSPTQEVEREEVVSRIEAAMKDLSDKHKEVFLLYSYEELHYEEIAEVLGIPIGTVMSRLFYARKQLREVLPQEWDPGGPRRREDRRAHG